MLNENVMYDKDELKLIGLSAGEVSEFIKKIEKLNNL